MPYLVKVIMLWSKNSTANVKFISLIVFTSIRTIFIDIITVNDSETYRLLESHFTDGKFDQVRVLSACEYRKELED